MVRDLPQKWSYQNESLQQRFAANLPKGTISGIQQYLFCDTDKMSVAPLIDAPILGIDPVQWSKDETSAFLFSYLPLDCVDPVERKARQQTKFPIEITLSSRAYRKVAASDFPPRASETVPFDVKIEQDINTPPKVFAADPKSTKKACLLDLGTQF